jgi:hypothetical protein
MPRSFIIFTACLLVTSVLTNGFEFCSDQDGGGICPTGNTCCRYLDSTISYVSSGCIPNDLGSYNASCCYETNYATSGCPVGYTCVDNSAAIGDFGTDATCLATTDKSWASPDPLLTVLPRYPLYPCPQIQHIYGFSIRQDHIVGRSSDVRFRGSSGIRNIEGNEAKLAYYSSHGNLQDDDNESWRLEIKQVIFMIHGANRNADDYFCSTQSLLSHPPKNVQNVLPLQSVLLIAPWFATTVDGDIPLTNGGAALRWNGSDVSGTWRYGANAIFPSFVRRHSTSTYSSFALLDSMISFVLESIEHVTDGSHVRQQRFPNLQRLVVAGHSSGGQFVQRWSLLTSIWDRQVIKSVVANPSSYAYLTPLRNSNGEWSMPKKEFCIDYNHWEWGMGDFNDSLSAMGWKSTLDVPVYVQRAMSLYGNIQNLTNAFALRDVTYLAGGLDVCNIPGSAASKGWCNSHGLETTCGDLLQGFNRLERHHWYCASLMVFNISHRCYVVPGVGHDHSLMFSSVIGKESLLGPVTFTSSTDNISV